MPYQYTPYTLPLAFAVALAFASAYLAWGKRDRAGVRWYGATMVAIAAWSASLALVVSSTTLRGKLFWFAVLLPTTAYLAISWTLFAVTYTGREEWITRPRLAVLALSPIPWLVLTLTTDAHGLVLVAPRLDASGGFVQLAYDWGPVVWLYVACGYALLAVGNSLLFWKFLHSRNVYRKYSFSMFMGSIFLWFSTIPSFAGLSPLPHLMLLPMGFLVVGVVSVAFLYSVKFVKLVPMDQILGRFSARFESLLPLARDYIVEELDSGVIVLDVEDRIVDINPMGRRILGEDRQVVGRRIYDVVDLDAVLSEFDPGDELTEFTSVEWVHTPNGLRCFDITVSNLTDSTGALAGRVAIVYDITDQKRREEALEEREAELEAQKRDLQQQTQKLEHQNDRLDEFASIVSHDLRNPLNVAAGHLTLIEGEEYREHVEQIREAHDRMEAIIDDALTLARQGKAITETEPVPVAEAAERAWATVETGDATLEITADGTVDADRERLRTVFENLFGNALEHGRRPPGRRFLRRRRRPGHSGRRTRGRVRPGIHHDRGRNGAGPRHRRQRRERPRMVDSRDRRRRRRGAVRDRAASRVVGTQPKSSGAGRDPDLAEPSPDHPSPVPRPTVTPSRRPRTRTWRHRRAPRSPRPSSRGRPPRPSRSAVRTPSHRATSSSRRRTPGRGPPAGFPARRPRRRIRRRARPR
jgi:PAS domain S-box-containing protein